MAIDISLSRLTAFSPNFSRSLTRLVSEVTSSVSNLFREARDHFAKEVREFRKATEVNRELKKISNEFPVPPAFSNFRRRVDSINETHAMRRDVILSRGEEPLPIDLVTRLQPYSRRNQEVTAQSIVGVGLCNFFGGVHTQLLPKSEALPNAAQNLNDTWTDFLGIPASLPLTLEERLQKEIQEIEEFDREEQAQTQPPLEDLPDLCDLPPLNEPESYPHDSGMHSRPALLAALEGGGAPTQPNPGGAKVLPFRRAG